RQRGDGQREETYRFYQGFEMRERHFDTPEILFSQLMFYRTPVSVGKRGGGPPKLRILPIISCSGKIGKK
ncbi:MAG: hypothetical protein IJJ20_03880, partial [Thermoguttaceae bacterium]|nr:hypothetical protein [Thermoguttaceae bacterium]